MSSKNKKPQSVDLSALLKGLDEAGVEFIVVGGMAAVVQGAPITTFDLDIVHRQTDGNITRLIKYLKSIDAYLRRPLYFIQYKPFNNTDYVSDEYIWIGIGSDPGIPMSAI